jgi:hypothetical protein
MSTFLINYRSAFVFAIILMTFLSGCATSKPEKITLAEVNRTAYKDIVIKDSRIVEKANSTDVDTFMGVGERVSESLIEPSLLDSARFYLGDFFSLQSYSHYSNLSIELLELDIAQVKGRAAPINNPAPVPGVGVLAAVLAGFVIQGIENFRVPDSLVTEVVMKSKDKRFKCNGSQPIKHRTYDEALSLSLRSAMYSCGALMLTNNATPAVKELKTDSFVDGMNIIK